MLAKERQALCNLQVKLMCDRQLVISPTTATRRFPDMNIHARACSYDHTTLTEDT